MSLLSHLPNQVIGFSLCLNNVYADAGHGHLVLRPQSLFTLSAPAVEMMDTFSLPIVISLTGPWSPAYTIRFQRLKVADSDTFQSSPVVST